MPSQAAQRTFPPFVRWALIVTAVVIGAGYALGPDSWHSSSSFDVLKSISWFPIRAWGFCFMFAGVLMSATKLAGYALAVVLWSTWGMGLLITAFDGNLQAWGGAIWPFFFAAVCGYEVYRWGQYELVRLRAGR
jgi:hypothetical protein